MVRWPIAAIDAGTSVVDGSLLSYAPGPGYTAGRHDDHGEQHVLLPVMPW
jgi:hypothetical protein